MWLRLLADLFLRETVLPEVRRQVTSAAKESIQREVVVSPETPVQLPADILILFALGAESGALVDRMTKLTKTRCESFFEYDGLLQIAEEQDSQRVVVIDTGVGMKAAAIAVEESIKLHKPRWVVSAGFAGGLAEPLRRGHFLIASDIACDVASPDGIQEPIDLGWKFDPSTMGRSVHIGRLVTVGKVLGKESEKRAAGERTGAVACDMETYAIAAACQKSGTPLLSIRIISDAVEDNLPPEIERLLNQKSLAAKLGAAAGAVMGRFSAAKDLWQLHLDSVKASQRLAKFIVSMLREWTSS